MPLQRKERQEERQKTGELLISRFSILEGNELDM